MNPNMMNPNMMNPNMMNPNLMNPNMTNSAATTGNHPFTEELDGRVHLFVDVLVIGGGPAGLIAAERAAAAAPWAKIRVVDAQRSPGRKFLLAGRSGLNLSNDEPVTHLLTKFSGTAAAYVRSCVEQFPPAELRLWADDLGEQTFVGTSGRVFPASMRATPLLRAWLSRLAAMGVDVTTEWRADIASALMIGTPNSTEPTAAASHRVVLNGVGRRSSQREVIEARAVLLALGGGSWPRTGSDGEWVKTFKDASVATHALGASNVGARIAWSAVFLGRYEGEPIKNVALMCGDRTTVGDVVVTRSGLEGGPVYTLSPALRDGSPLVCNLRPDVSVADTERALSKARAGDSLSNRLRKAGLSPAAIGLMLECGARDVAQRPAAEQFAALAALVHRLPVPVIGVAGLERAISSSGGVAGQAIDDTGMLLRNPGVFLAGEMLDWEAPTGGYLLQGCWSTGYSAGVAAAGYVAP